jgi:hypothetical protein
MSLKELIIGRIYVSKIDGFVFRIFKLGGGGNYSGRGCTKETATPYNYLKPEDMREATLKQVNTFLEEEMKNGMAQTINRT